MDLKVFILQKYKENFDKKLIINREYKRYNYQNFVLIIHLNQNFVF